jgi:hypothetical protein
VAQEDREAASPAVTTGPLTGSDLGTRHEKQPCQRLHGVERHVERQHRPLREPAEDDFGRRRPESAGELAEERLHLGARHVESLGDRVPVGRMALRLTPGACLQIDVPPRAAARVSATQVQRRLGKHEACIGWRTERAPERHEVVAGSPETVKENDDGPRACTFPVRSARDPHAEV